MKFLKENDINKCFDKINENDRSKLGSDSNPPFESGWGFGSLHFLKRKFNNTVNKKN